MAIKVEYDLIPWEDAPSTATPINAENLNKQQAKIKEIIDGLHKLDEAKLGKEEVPNVPVKSVNGKTGAVSLGKTDIGLGNVDNVKQYSASNPPPYPVTSVNGKTGAVTVSVPTKTSQLTNDSNFVTKSVTDALSGQIVDQQVLLDGKQPVGNYLTSIPSEYVTEDELEAEITDLKAQGVQQTPLFANSIEECTDTTKMYVLPDGYIYGYLYQEGGLPYTNRLPLSVDTDGTTIFNGVGYLNGYRLNSSGAQTACAGMMVSGYIPCKHGDIIRIKGMGQTTTSYAQMNEFYNSNKESLVCKIGIQNISGTTVSGVTIEDGIITIDTNKNTNTASATGIAFFRCSYGDLSNAIVTVNEEIVEGTTSGGYAWVNTGRAFVPTDYEDRIIDVEEEVDILKLMTNTHDSRIKSLESSSMESGNHPIPDYWEDAITTAETKIKALQDNGGIDCVQFVWASDTHCRPNASASGSNSTARNVGVLANRLMNDMNIPFFVVSGDLSADIGGSTTYPLKEDIDTFFDEIVKPVGKERVLSALGNHDGTSIVSNGSGGYNYPSLSREERFNWFMRPFCDDSKRVWGGAEYYYVDFTQGKTRFIVLSSNNIPYTVDSNHLPSPNVFQNPKYDVEQIKWLSEIALDVPNGYTVVVVTHIPFNGTNSATLPVNSDTLLAILTAFDNKVNYSVTLEGMSIAKNYANSGGTMCGIFAGHIHEDMIDSSRGYPIITIDCAGNKTSVTDRTFSDGTASETLFDVVSINKATRTISMTRIGVGEDRQVSY